MNISLTGASEESSLDLVPRIIWPWWVLPPILLGILILPFVRWGFTDDDIFIFHYLVGQPYPMPIWSNGRFFPLGHQEWRLVPWIRQAWMFHAVALAEYGLFCFVVWRIMGAKHLTKGLAEFFVVVTLPPIVVSFSNIILPERNQLTLIALWFMFYEIWECNGRVWSGLLSLVCANLALYFKEPTFLFLGGFAFVQKVVFFKSKGTLKFYRERWADIALLGSCAIFLLAYFSVESVHTITGPSSYATISMKKSLLTLGVLAVKDPLLLPLMLLGLGLAIHSLIVVKSWPTYFGLWVGSTLYLCSLTFIGLHGTYYDALSVFGFALQITRGELVQRSLNNPTKVLCWGLVLVNAIFWAPAIAFKYDLTERNKELADHILEYSVGRQTRILITRSDTWDTAMFIDYAEGIRGIKAQFFCDGAILSSNTMMTYFNFPDVPRPDQIIVGQAGLQYKWDGVKWVAAGGAPCQPYDEQSDIGITINLGQTHGERIGTLNIGPKETWRYRGVWVRLIPKTIRRLLKYQYNIWGMPIVVEN